jgi:hypothetical protein
MRRAAFVFFALPGHPKRVTEMTIKKTKKRRATKRRGGYQLAPQLSNDARAVLSFREWCALNNISVRTGRAYNHQQRKARREATLP